MSGGWAPRRFWREASVAALEGGWTVRLDGRPLHTPAGAPLRLPSRPFAAAVAAEWDAQGERIAPLTMPATRLANTAIDRVAAARDEVVATLAAYAGSDLLCHRAERPEALARRQAALWDPPLAWCAEALGAELVAAAGVMPVAQPPLALARLRARVAAMGDFSLAAFHDLVQLSGSVVLALAAAEGRLAPEEAWRLSRLDEDWQAEEWGLDDEAEAAAAGRRAAFLQAARAWDLVADR
jgi:chaperone required for assembly of F1-ATPase